MKLDRSKKYEGLGLTLDYCPPFWAGTDEGFNDITIDEPIVEAWLDAGHIKPVRETKIVRVEGCVAFKHRDGGLAIDCAAWRDIPDGARSKPFAAEFEVEA